MADNPWTLKPGEIIGDAQPAPISSPKEWIEMAGTRPFLLGIAQEALGGWTPERLAAFLATDASTVWYWAWLSGTETLAPRIRFAAKERPTRPTSTYGLGEVSRQTGVWDPHRDRLLIRPCMEGLLTTYPAAQAGWYQSPDGRVVQLRDGLWVDAQGTPIALPTVPRLVRLEAE